MEALALYDYTAQERDELSFKKSELIKVLDTNPDMGWYKAEIGGRRGLVPNNFVELRPHNWFYGHISREEAQAKLINEAEGRFLVRISLNTSFSLSVRCSAAVKHFRILNNNPGRYSLWEEKFNSLNQLLEHHKHVSVSRTEQIMLKEVLVEVQFDFSSAEPGCLEVKKGDVISVTDSSGSDWWMGEVNTRTGFFPANYVQPYNPS